MNLKNLYIIGGLVVLLIALIPLRRNLDSFKTQMTGDLITVTVTYVPKCEYSMDVYYYIKFKYIDKGVLVERTKNIYDTKLCNELVVGQELKLKVDLNKKIFLYENENVSKQFYSLVVLGLFGLAVLIFGLTSKR